MGGAPSKAGAQAKAGAPSTAVTPSTPGARPKVEQKFVPKKTLGTKISPVK
jgi:hypothetical protein